LEDSQKLSLISEAMASSMNRVYLCSDIGIIEFMKYFQNLIASSLKASGQSIAIEYKDETTVYLRNNLIGPDYAAHLFAITGFSSLMLLNYGGSVNKPVIFGLDEKYLPPYDTISYLNSDKICTFVRALLYKIFSPESYRGESSFRGGERVGGARTNGVILSESHVVLCELFILKILDNFKEGDELSLANFLEKISDVCVTASDLNNIEIRGEDFGKISGNLSSIIGPGLSIYQFINLGLLDKLKNIFAIKVKSMQQLADESKPGG
jgi:hypothetical protein